MTYLRSRSATVRAYRLARDDPRLSAAIRAMYEVAGRQPASRAPIMSKILAMQLYDLGRRPGWPAIGEVDGATFHDLWIDDQIRDTRAERAVPGTLR